MSWESKQLLPILDSQFSISLHWSYINYSRPIQWPVAVTVGNTAIFAGGVVGNLTVLGAEIVADVTMYDCSTDTWSYHNLSVARFLLAAATVNNIAAFVGGTTSQLDDATDAVDLYNLDTQEWTTLTLSQLLAVTLWLLESVGPATSSSLMEAILAQPLSHKQISTISLQGVGVVIPML